MGDEKHWHLLCYDIREPKRWAKVYKILKGRGERIQLSVFRLQMTRIQNEELRWKLAKVMDKEDSLLILRLCPGCAADRRYRGRGELEESGSDVRCHLIMDGGKVNVPLIFGSRNRMKTEWKDRPEAGRDA